ncbi:MAG TPA: alcohol dehydrogenase catalytic domain-containing protein, partial [Opitutaceae bacterium]
MKGLFLNEVGGAVVLREDLPEPELRPGAAIVRMLAAPVLSYTKQVHSGKLGYLLPTPFIPGNSGVGLIEKVSEDISHLKPGQPVAIDPRMVSHTAEGPD